MAEETKKTPQTPEEIAREAQAQAMKAALEQAQALYGNIPGFEGTDLMKMHEKLMQDSAEMFRFFFAIRLLLVNTAHKIIMSSTTIIHITAIIIFSDGFRHTIQPV